ncbi:hypothetical protein C8R46DRAFT_1028360 [Mycena filopes]|nr:hypothetical protein C8R46DRAFT_1028360 [Mycena filopes]
MSSTHDGHKADEFKEKRHSVRTRRLDFKLWLELISLTQGGLPDDFPPEIMSGIFLGLPYRDLLRISGVSKKWKNIIEADPAICVQRFKKASQTDVEPGDGTTTEALEVGSDKIRMHPVLKRISFVLGDDLSDARLYTGSGLDDCPLAATAVAHDLASIPAVEKFVIVFEMSNYMFDYSLSGLPHRQTSLWSKVDVLNPNGVRIVDIFTMLSNASRRMIPTDDGPLLLCEAVEGHIFYEGFGCLRRMGATLSASIDLGS